MGRSSNRKKNRKITTEPVIETPTIRNSTQAKTGNSISLSRKIAAGLFILVIGIFTFVKLYDRYFPPKEKSIIEKTDKGNVIDSSKNIGIDSLKKYSHYLAVFQHDGLVSNGTGFFFRKKDRLFLISNYHVFTGQNTMVKNWIKLDSMILFTEVQNNKIYTYKIDLKEISENSKPHLFYEYPDIYVYEVTNKLPKEITAHSIEKFLPVSFNNEKPDEILSYGFTQKSVFYDPIKMNFNYLNEPYKSVEFDYDREGNHVVMTNSYFVGLQSIGGMSGSPLFYIYTLGTNKKVVFAGVISSHIKQFNKTLIVKPEMVLSLIDEKLKNNGN